MDMSDDGWHFYMSAVVNCDIHSDYLPVTPQGDLDILKMIGDFCKLPSMLPHIHSFIDALWEFNLGEA
tara:strand:- start:355 stop:558 length:204 start_codon:yes stop_codon:yes gene_type:complete